jgi:hypothetical protein
MRALNKEEMSVVAGGSNTVTNNQNSNHQHFQSDNSFAFTFATEVEYNQTSALILQQGQNIGPTTGSVSL